MSKEKIYTRRLFTGKNDIRKYLKIDIRDEQKELLAQEFYLDEDIIDYILRYAIAYVDMRNAPEYIEIETEDNQ